ncbi:MAG: tellurite resistance TerB C-terminal domain-containing protein, partial [Kovacikia sp.]
MLKSRLLLGSIAFGVSFGINFLTSRDASKALVAGLTTVPAAVIAAAVVDRRSYLQGETRLAVLKKHIRALQQRRAEAYRALLDVENTQKEQTVLSFNSVPLQPQRRQLPVSPPPAQKVISWNLSAPFKSASEEAVIEVKPYELPTELQIPQKSEAKTNQIHESETELNQVLADATVAKRKIEANLNLLQSELSQIKTQVADQRQARDKLVRELADLKQQKQRLEAESLTVKRDVDDLRRCQAELEQFLTYAEGKKKELETGSHPLQTALKDLQTQVNKLQDELHRLEIQVSDRKIQKNDLDRQLTSHPLHASLKQLQTQVNALQGELQGLETQIAERRSQKNNLEQQISALNAQQQTLKNRPIRIEPSSGEKNGNNGHGTHPAKKSANEGKVDKARISQPDSAEAVSPPVPAVVQSSTAVKPDAAKAEKAADLPPEWTEFMVQLPEYELQVLKAIMEQNNPAGVIKKIAEDNLTMPEALIDSINEQALESIG